MRRRSLIAVFVGMFAGMLARAFLARRSHLAGGDFGYVWRAAGHLVHGRNPYDAMPPGPRYGVDGPFLYPLPAVVLALPLARLDATIASAVFVAASTALMAFGLSAAGW